MVSGPRASANNTTAGRPATRTKTTQTWVATSLMKRSNGSCDAVFGGAPRYASFAPARPITGGASADTSSSRNAWTSPNAGFSEIPAKSAFFHREHANPARHRTHPFNQAIDDDRRATAPSPSRRARPPMSANGASGANGENETAGGRRGLAQGNLAARADRRNRGSAAEYRTNARRAHTGRVSARARRRRPPSPSEGMASASRRPNRRRATCAPRFSNGRRTLRRYDYRKDGPAATSTAPVRGSRRTGIAGEILTGEGSGGALR